MGVFAGVLFFVLLLSVALFMILAGVAGAVGFGVAHKKGILKKGKLFILLSVGVLLAGVLLSSLPLGFFSFIIATNATPPEDYVETGIDVEVINKDYESYSFIAQGTVYTILDLESANISLEHPVFSQKEKGPLNRAQWSNYYEVKNDSGFHIVCDEGGVLFAPREDHEQIYAYYENDTPVWFAEFWDDDQDRILIKHEILEGSLEDLCKRESTLPYEHYSFTETQTNRTLWCTKESTDGVVLYKSLSFELIEGSAYLIRWEQWEQEGYILNAYKTDEETASLLLWYANDK